MATKYQIKNDRLVIDGTPVRFEQSPNHGGRIRPRKIIMHDTASHNLAGPVAWFKNRKSGVSAHFVVDRDGTIVQMVECDIRGQHAGVSSWKGERNCNGYTIGIEMVNVGRMTARGSQAVTWYGHTIPLDQCIRQKTKSHGDGYWQTYTNEQMTAVCRLIQALSTAYPSIDEVIGHFHVSPGRKVDPNPLFSFDQARYALRSVKPNIPQPKPEPEVVAEAQRRLGELHYGPGDIDGFAGPITEKAVGSFQKENGLPMTGELDKPTLEKIGDEKAKAFPTGAREEATPKDLAHRSRTEDTATKGRRDASLTIVAGLIAGLMSTMEAVTRSIDKLSASPAGICILVAAGFLLVVAVTDYVRFGRIRWFRLSDHQTSKHTGGL
jgi:N-acetyl-anhydromuramyl-L-alanine amidase AmpD